MCIECAAYMASAGYLGVCRGVGAFVKHRNLSQDGFNRRRFETGLYELTQFRSNRLRQSNDC